MTTRIALNSRVWLVVGLLALGLLAWLGWSLRPRPELKVAAPRSPAPASAPIADAPRTVYKCVRVGYLPRFSEHPCPPGVDLQMVEIPPLPAASQR